MPRIGIMGGTFNPIHTGHLIIAQLTLIRLKLDKIWFMPAGNPPHKAAPVIDGELRRRMVELAIEGNPEFELFDYELKKDRPSYSAMTMTELDEAYPENEFYFIMGADSLMDFHKWYHPEIICAHTKLVCADRNNISDDRINAEKERLETDFGATIYLIDTPQIGISSSDIRDRLKDKPSSVRYMLPEKVYDFIIKNHLYSV